VKGLTGLESLYVTTTGEDLFLSMCETMKELLWSMLKGMTEGATSMIGKQTGLMGGIRQEVEKQNPKFYMGLYQ
jgi:hypothetical protein